MNPKIGIIIVNYNGERYAKDCIKSVLKSSYQDYLFIVVYNASTDNFVKL
jgi:Glycosyl transferase family 2.